MKPNIVNVSVIFSALVDLFSLYMELAQKAASHSSMITSALRDLYTVGGFYSELGIYSPIFGLV